MVEAEARGWPPLPGAGLAYITAGLDVRFIRPAPLTETVNLRAMITTADEPEITAEVELVHGDKVRATAVARWRRWRPR
jgi:acyl-CoA thioesterase FadM